MLLDFIDEASVPPRSVESAAFPPESAEKCWETLDKLFDMGIVKEVEKGGSHRENPLFCIPTSGSELRTILDVSDLGPYILGKRFKFDDLHAFLMRVQRGDYVRLAPR